MVLIGFKRTRVLQNTLPYILKKVNCKVFFLRVICLILGKFCQGGDDESDDNIAGENYYQADNRIGDSFFPLVNHVGFALRKNPHQAAINKNN
ncbi:hypothetical protein COT97_02195 [Candidatus Falkowbacteria bacterium CG10_big_fil_rev_8_21_14_0_10_39_11]|uniref:Uncharacterized protein n=1 Tax=Candidatus Falkowbacteria bacterium CG10_big_fil_rev_8_21_14_0_10_39_11 TaxID=1974565 RepID=A0A2H0V7G2_9BACT|nr:MAG: hypothetical protein COT97_02195 [Candidatus Falkowbacteria bacterium CG10_big_fil_rev_8_21_14_0_10_39_11]